MGFISFTSSFATAAPSLGFTYEGVLEMNGVVVGQHAPIAKQFKFEVVGQTDNDHDGAFSEAESCVLLREIHPAVIVTAGSFAVAIGKQTAPNYAVSGGIMKAFGMIAMTGEGSCPFDPNSAVGIQRALRISVLDSATSSYVTIGTTPITSAPNAMIAARLGSRTENDFLQINASQNLTQENAEAFFSRAVSSSGTSAAYYDSSTGAFVTYDPTDAGVLANKTIAPAKLADCANGQILKFIAPSGWTCFTPVATAETDPTVAAWAKSAATPATADFDVSSNTLTLKNIGTGGTAAKVTYDSKGRVIGGEALTVGDIESPSGQYFGYKPNGAACDDLEVLKWDTASQHWICGVDNGGSGGGGGSLATLTASPPLVKSGTATDPVLGLPAADATHDGYLKQGDFSVFSAKLSPALADGKIWIGNSNTATALALSGDATMTSGGTVSVNKIHGTLVSTTAPSATGQYLRYDGTKYAPELMTMADLHSSMGPGFVSFFPASACGNDQTLKWSSATDTLECQNISISLTSNVSNVLPVANGGTGTANGSIAGTGALAFVAGGTGKSVTLTPSTGGFIVLGGNVGIGSTTPAASLDLSQKTDALILPSGNTAARPAAMNGMIRYNSQTNDVESYVNGSWREMALSSGFLPLAGGSLTGNLTVTTGGLAVSAGGASVTGGINANNGAISSVGSLTGSGALAITAGGSNQSLTLNAAGTGNVVVGTGKLAVGSASASFPQISDPRLFVTDGTDAISAGFEGGAPRLGFADDASSVKWYLENGLGNFRVMKHDGSTGSQAMIFGATGNVGFGSLTAPAYTLTLPIGTATVGIENAASTFAGGALVLQAGSAGAGTDLAGGDLTISSGASTGKGSSNIVFKTPVPSASGGAVRSPAAAMTIVGGGAIVGKATFDNLSSTSIDFGNGNIQSTTASCGSFTLKNLRDGGTYVLVVKGATSATCTFTATNETGAAVTVHYPLSHGPTIANKHTMYNLIVTNGDVYMSWMSGL